MKHKNWAFTIVEVLIAISIIAFIAVLSIKNHSNVTFKVDKVKFKNAYVSLKYAIDGLITNPHYYADDFGFYDLNEVTFENKSESGIPYKGEYKFRNLLLREMGTLVTQKPYDCYMLDSKSGDGHAIPSRKNLCYKTENSVIWGIPNTDFDKYGVVQKANLTSGTSKYVPITIYLNNDDINTKEGFEEKAVIIGVRADGAITLVNSVDCNQEKYQKFLQCNISDMFTSLNSK